MKKSSFEQIQDLIIESEIEDRKSNYIESIAYLNDAIFLINQENMEKTAATNIGDVWTRAPGESGLNAYNPIDTAWKMSQTPWALAKDIGKGLWRGTRALTGGGLANLKNDLAEAQRTLADLNARKTQVEQRVQQITQQMNQATGLQNSQTPPQNMQQQPQQMQTPAQQ